MLLRRSFCCFFFIRLHYVASSCFSALARAQPFFSELYNTQICTYIGCVWARAPACVCMLLFVCYYVYARFCNARCILYLMLFHFRLVTFHAFSFSFTLFCFVLFLFLCVCMFFLVSVLLSCVHVYFLFIQFMSHFAFTIFAHSQPEIQYTHAMV